MARKHRFTSQMTPGSLTLPGVAKDPGVKAQFKSLTRPRRVDPRGQAMGELAQAKGNYADAQRGLADRTRQGGTIVSNAMNRYAESVSRQGDAVAESGRVIGNAQEMFARSFTTLANAFETLGNARKPKENELAVTKAAFNLERASLDFQTEEKKNPNPKRYSGKAYLDDYDSRHTKPLDAAVKATEEELGYSFDTETSEKVQALVLRTRLQGLERAANDEHTRYVTQMIETANLDAVTSNKQTESDGDIGAGIARGEKISERLNGVASAEHYLSFREATRMASYEAGIRYRLNKGDVAGAKAIYQQLTGIAGETATGNVRLLIDAANERGLPPEFMVAASYHETAGTFSSKIKPMKNGRPMSSAAGLGQLTGPMAKAYLGVSDASAASPATQAAGWAKYTEDHYRGLRKVLGRAPSYGELMLAQFVGFGRATRIIGAVYSGKGDVPLSKFLPEEVIRNTGLTDAPTAEAALQKAETVIQTALEKVYGTGVMTGKELPQDASALPIDDVHRRVGGLISAYETAEANDPDIDALKKETTKTGIDLMLSGQLTKQWLQANREILTPSNYAAFSKALLAPGEQRMTPPEELVRLEDLVDSDPIAAQEEIRDLFLADRLNGEDYRRLTSRARTNQDPLRGNPVKKEIRSLVRAQLTPSRDIRGNFNRNEYNRQFEAGAAFDDWVEAHPQATREEMYKAGQEIIKFFKDTKYKEGTTLIERPKYVNKNPQDITIEDIQAARARLGAEVKAGTLDPQEAVRLEKINRSWLEVLQNKETTGKK